MDHGEILGRIGFWKILVEINQAKYSTSAKGEEETTLWLWASSDEYSDGGSGELNGEDLARFHGLVLPRSRGSEIKFGVLNAEMGLRRMEVWRCSVPLRARYWS
ncbi:hypothetical protein Acr_09g0002210 [Actinidia rufa]|uniref:Uncharacterized protein n=1 Tax=Actinidia rufa TaxID=165716 RepID=A0A7J0F500_9ERIC|nr:hypothetical protein Acr_09g0002210 [Actinidia rufa]